METEMKTIGYGIFCGYQARKHLNRGYNERWLGYFNLIKENAFKYAEGLFEGTGLREGKDYFVLEAFERKNLQHKNK